MVSPQYKLPASTLIYIYAREN